MAPLWPLAAFFVLVMVLVTAILGLSSILGERHRERRTGEPYESGILPTGSARRRVSIKYYLVAVAFVVFDLIGSFGKQDVMTLVFLDQWNKYTGVPIMGRRITDSDRLS